MANVSARDAKELHDMTGCGMMDCKKALEQANGNRDEAVKILREMGLAKQAKKAGRIAAEGVAKAMVRDNIGVVVEVNCETDFCAKSEKFLELVDVVANSILDNNVDSVEALMGCKASGTDETIESYLTNKVGAIGENIKIRRFTKMEGTLIAYMHDGGRFGTLVKLDTDKPDNAEVLACGKNVALQATALGALYVGKDNIPADVLAGEQEVQLNLVKKENAESAKPKPENVLQKIVEGRMRKYFEEVCLLEQKYFKDDSMNMAKYIESVEKAQGCSIKIDNFVRFERGEGIEKKQDDFAAEVAQLAGN